VLIMEGANDLFVSRDSRIEPSVLAGLRQMVRDAKSRGIRPMLATLPPEKDGCCPINRGAAWRQVPGFNDNIRQIAIDESVPLVDIYLDMMGNADPFVGPDGLHLTQTGYTQVAKSFFDVIVRNLESSAATTIDAAGRLRLFARPGLRR